MVSGFTILMTVFAWPRAPGAAIVMKSEPGSAGLTAHAFTRCARHKSGRARRGGDRIADVTDSSSAQISSLRYLLTSVRIDFHCNRFRVRAGVA